MAEDYDERSGFFNRRTDKSIISKSFTDGVSGRRLRIASHVFDGAPGLKTATVAGELVLRETPGGRYEIKATFFENDRSIKTLTIQKYNSKSGPSDKWYFSFIGDEIDDLIRFIAGIKTVPLEESGKVHVSDDVLRDIVLDQGQARRVFVKNAELFLHLAQQEDITRDLVAVGFRRKQLQRFESLLNDPAYFAEEQNRLECRPEDVWQQFFEANTWIFGYGLSYQFASKLDEKKLEQIVRGRDLTGAGKRSDALMKTRGLISSLCFIEIKRHDTPLLGQKPYRAEAWPPSAELVGGVSQLQTTVYGAVESLGHRLMPSDDFGDPTGEILFNIEPRSCLVVGSLGQFQTDQGINVPKFRSFELYRRHTWRPEIITFDELLQRARFIVEHGPGETATEECDDDEEIPF